MKNGYIIDNLTSLVFQEIVKEGGKVIRIYEGVIYRESFKISPLRRVIEKIFNLGQKYKGEKNDFLQGLLELFINSLYRVQRRKDFKESCFCKSETWMKTAFDEIVSDYRRLPIGNYILKMRKNDGLDDDCDFKSNLPAHLGAFILSNSKRIMNNFIKELNNIFIKSINYGDTDSLYTEKKYWDVLDKTTLVGKELCRGKNDDEVGGVFYSCFLPPKTKNCSTICEYGVFQEYKTFKKFNDYKRLLDRSQSFKMIEGKKISSLLPKKWKKSFVSGIIIPLKMRFCNECKDKILFTTCNNQVNENKEFETNLNLLKREAPNQFGYMLPKYKTKFSRFCTNSHVK